MTGKFSKNSARLVDPHIQHVGDRAIAVANFQRLPIESLPFADRADDVEIGEKIHFDPPQSLALALFASASFGVEAEPAGAIAAPLGFASVDKHSPHFIEHAGVRGRIAPRRAADRRLIDFDEFVDLVHAAQAGVRAWLRAGAGEPAMRSPGPMFRSRASSCPSRSLR